MTKRVYSLRDAKAEIFTQPFFKLSHGEAERDFKNLISNKETTPGRFPEDFDLYYLGTYDDVSGRIESLDTPQHVVKGVNVMSQVQ